ncbi:hypothetical protein Btru_061211, partial [Bulinus truncatus]
MLIFRKQQNILVITVNSIDIVSVKVSNFSFLFRSIGKTIEPTVWRTPSQLTLSNSSALFNKTSLFCSKSVIRLSTYLSSNFSFLFRSIGKTIEPTVWRTPSQSTLSNSSALFNKTSLFCSKSVIRLSTYCVLRLSQLRLSKFSFLFRSVVSLDCPHTCRLIFHFFSEVLVRQSSPLFGGHLASQHCPTLQLFSIKLLCFAQKVSLDCPHTGSLIFHFFSEVLVRQSSRLFGGHLASQHCLTLQLFSIKLLCFAQKVSLDCPHTCRLIFHFFSEVLVRQSSPLFGGHLASQHCPTLQLFSIKLLCFAQKVSLDCPHTGSLIFHFFSEVLVRQSSRLFGGHLASQHCLTLQLFSIKLLCFAQKVSLDCPHTGSLIFHFFSEVLARQSSPLCLIFHFFSEVSVRQSSRLFGGHLASQHCLTLQLFSIKLLCFAQKVSLDCPHTGSLIFHFFSEVSVRQSSRLFGGHLASQHCLTLQLFSIKLLCFAQKVSLDCPHTCRLIFHFFSEVLVIKSSPLFGRHLASQHCPTLQLFSIKLLCFAQKVSLDCPHTGSLIFHFFSEVLVRQSSRLFGGHLASQHCLTLQLFSIKLLCFAQKVSLDCPHTGSLIFHFFSEVLARQSSPLFGGHLASQHCLTLQLFSIKLLCFAQKVSLDCPHTCRLIFHFFSEVLVRQSSPLFGGHLASQHCPTLQLFSIKLLCFAQKVSLDCPHTGSLIFHFFSEVLVRQSSPLFGGHLAKVSVRQSSRLFGGHLASQHCLTLQLFSIKLLCFAQKVSLDCPHTCRLIFHFFSEVLVRQSSPLFGGHLASQHCPTLQLFSIKLLCFAQKVSLDCPHTGSLIFHFFSEVLVRQSSRLFGGHLASQHCLTLQLFSIKLLCFAQKVSLDCPHTCRLIFHFFSEVLVRQSSPLFGGHLASQHCPTLQLFSIKLLCFAQKVSLDCPHTGSLIFHFFSEVLVRQSSRLFGGHLASQHCLTLQLFSIKLLCFAQKVSLDCPHTGSLIFHFFSEVLARQSSPLCLIFHFFSEVSVRQSSRLFGGHLASQHCLTLQLFSIKLLCFAQKVSLDCPHTGSLIFHFFSEVSVRQSSRLFGGHLASQHCLTLQLFSIKLLCFAQKVSLDCPHTCRLIFHFFSEVLVIKSSPLFGRHLASQHCPTLQLFSIKLLCFAQKVSLDCPHTGSLIFHFFSEVLVRQSSRLFGGHLASQHCLTLQLFSIKLLCFAQKVSLDCPHTGSLIFHFFSEVLARQSSPLCLIFHFFSEVSVRQSSRLFGGHLASQHCLTLQLFSIKLLCFAQKVSLDCPHTGSLIFHFFSEVSVRQSSPLFGGHLASRHCPTLQLFSIKLLCFAQKVSLDCPHTCRLIFHFFSEVLVRQSSPLFGGHLANQHCPTLQLFSIKLLCFAQKVSLDCPHTGSLIFHFFSEVLARQSSPLFGGHLASQHCQTLQLFSIKLLCFAQKVSLDCPHTGSLIFHFFSE